MSWLPGLEPATELPAENDGDGDEWYTPPEVIRAVCAAAGVDRIDVDPCYCDKGFTDPIRRIDVRQGGDGLTLSWGGPGFAFVNPPYSDAARWIERSHAQARDGYTVIMLIPMRPETAAWWRHVWTSGGYVVITRGRIRFVAPDGTRPGGGRIATAFVCWSRALVNRLANALQAEGIVATAIGVLP